MTCADTMMQGQPAYGRVHHDAPLDVLLDLAAERRDRSWGKRLTWSHKVFIPLTRLCRDVCSYCTFATTPSRLSAPFLELEEVLAIAREGKAAGCNEALFTLGDKPELRYGQAREWLRQRGYDSTIAYLAEAASLVLRETGLLPHLNPGVVTLEELQALRPFATSFGMMLESAAERLCDQGGPHYGSPDKHPRVRLDCLRDAGLVRMPTTTGLLIGIGETREERVEALEKIATLHREHGHIQEVIIQNFCAKSDTRMAQSEEPDLAELLWTVATARLVLPDDIGLQTPPNLNAGRTQQLVRAGINDWGGMSRVTIDHVNPEAPWPVVEKLAEECAGAGYTLVERLPIYPRFVGDLAAWVDPAIAHAIRYRSDGAGLAREVDWSPGQVRKSPGNILSPLPATPSRALAGKGALNGIGTLARFAAGQGEVSEIACLFDARGAAALEIINFADRLRRETKGDEVTYVVNRNINYTNICTYACKFCAFSKASSKGGFRDKPYLLAPGDVANRTVEAAERGATEVCLQGGIHPDFDGSTYLSICEAVHAACPDMHIHAFSPLEISHGASTLGISVREFLGMLKARGLSSLPGTAAEILHDEVRATLCPDKLTTSEWLDVVEEAHRVGIRTTATIMFGHIDRYEHWAVHLLAIRDLQRRTGGFTEFVPLPFVHMEAPAFLRGHARPGPTWREVVLMHAIARIVLHGQIDNIQTSWVKLGIDGAGACLAAGANDVGGVLMDESISRAAGAAHGQWLDLETLERELGPDRPLRCRSTFYGQPPVCHATDAQPARQTAEV